MHTLGVPKDWEICDVFGFGSDELAIVPRPVASVIMLFPDNDAVVFNFYFYGEKPLIIWILYLICSIKNVKTKKS